MSNPDTAADETNPTNPWEEGNGELNPVISPRRITIEQQPAPGPCPPPGCPPTTEIACIETDYIYDSCFLTVQRELTGAIPQVLDGLDSGADFSVNCQVQSLTCGEIERTPVDDNGDGKAHVTLRLQYTVLVSIVQNGTVFYQGTLNDTFFRTTTLCAPPGTVVDCARFSSAECRAFLVSFDEEPPQANIQVNVTVCLITQSCATVHLLVPTYGFCVPAECKEVPEPGCGTNLFPPTCGNIGNTTANNNQ